LQRVERAKDRVVVDVRADRVIGCVGIDQAFDREVQCVGAVEREDEMVRVLAVEEAAEAAAAFGDERAGFHRLGVRAAAGAGAQFLGVVDHRIGHRPRLGEAGGGVIHVQTTGRHRRNSRAMRGWGKGLGLCSLAVASFN
jgi:hypothetical protein